MKIVITLEPMKEPIAMNTAKRMELYAEVEQLAIKYKDSVVTTEMIGRN
jgi:hypothetical protein